jgi:hypothetical protein
MGILMTRSFRNALSSGLSSHTFKLVLVVLRETSALYSSTAALLSLFLKFFCHLFFITSILPLAEKVRKIYFYVNSCQAESFCHIL